METEQTEMNKQNLNCFGYKELTCGCIIDEYTGVIMLRKCNFHRFLNSIAYEQNQLEDLKDENN